MTDHAPAASDASVAIFDEFEIGILSVSRYLFLSFSEPERQSWQMASRVAVERWGEPLGLAAAYLTQKLVQAVLRERPRMFDIHDPQDISRRGEMTRDETNFLSMIHHMRRDQTGPGRNSVVALTDGNMSPDVIRAGLTLASRFSKGAPPMRGPGPALRVVG